MFDKVTRTAVRGADRRRASATSGSSTPDRSRTTGRCSGATTSGTHYSALKQIDTTNVERLQAPWALPMPGDSVLQATPIVVDGVM